MIDLAALESGDADLTIGTVDLAELAVEAAAGVAATAGPCGVTVTTELPPRLLVPGDRRRLRQAVDQVLLNAVTFSPDGARVTVTGRADGDVAVLTVTDAGSGVPAGEHEAVSGRLHRGSNARHGGIPGSGLGLALTRAVLRRHHGTVALTPARPAGTTATIRIPRVPPHPA